MGLKIFVQGIIWYDKALDYWVKMFNTEIIDNKSCKLAITCSFYEKWSHPLQGVSVCQGSNPLIQDISYRIWVFLLMSGCQLNTLDISPTVKM